MKRVVILLNMGGADDLSQVEVFLKNMFNDPYILNLKSIFIRKILAFMIVKTRLKSAINNYKEIGGKSPIGDITRSLVDKLNKISKDENLIFDYAMNYTPPFAIDTLKKYESADEIIFFPLYPHHSNTTITSSLESARSAARELGLKASIREVGYFYQDKKYNRIIIDSLIKKLKEDAVEASSVDLIFSAHSLPQKIIDNGDLYEEHIKKHLKILSKTLAKYGFRSVSLAYQSRLGPIKWLGPNISDILSRLSSRRALIYPISFCIDNSETDFELDIEYRKIATTREFTYYGVVKAPNDGDAFIDFINTKIESLSLK